MLNVPFRRKIVLLVLVAVLATPWASAAISQPENPRVQAVERAALGDLVSRLWSFLRSVGGKAGCEIDPNGRCMPTSPPPQDKEGCHIDPDGRCISEPTPKIGCNIDPDGRCIS